MNKEIKQLLVSDNLEDILLAAVLIKKQHPYSKILVYEGSEHIPQRLFDKIQKLREKEKLDFFDRPDLIREQMRRIVYDK